MDDQVQNCQKHPNRFRRRHAPSAIVIVYDHQRTPAGEILMATFREEDVRAGKPVSEKPRFRALIDHLPAP